MSKKDVVDLFEHLHGLAALIVADGEEHIPMIVSMAKDGLEVAALHSSLSKDMIAVLHRKLGKEKLSCLIMEAWMHEGTKKESTIAQAIERGDIKVADLPQRKEAIIFNFREPDGGQWLAICKIDRAAKNLAKGELLDLTDKDKEFSGRFVGLGLRKDVN